MSIDEKILLLYDSLTAEGKNLLLLAAERLAANTATKKE